MADLLQSAEREGTRRAALKSLSDETVKALGLESVRDRMFRSSQESKFEARIEEKG